MNSWMILSAIYTQYLYHHYLLWFVWQYKLYQWNAFPFRLAKLTRVFTALTKPILFLCSWKGFHISIFLDDVIVLIPSKCAGREHKPFCAPVLVCLGLHINYDKSELHLSQNFCFPGCHWDTVDMSLSLASDYSLRYSSWLLYFCRLSLLQFIWSCPFLARLFCANGHAQHYQLYYVIQDNMLNVYHFPADFFLSCHLSISAQHQVKSLSQLWKSPVSLQFPLCDVVIATNAMPNHCVFYFQGSGLPFSISSTWWDSMHRAHIALQLQLH